ncbi:hypothetical protein HAX54_044079 [Datura stramonium]|uniref:Uncharacterized protein n=1 Tax=Datura stramonium TaxID=4076 RepID=A0ABS8SP93_DATST|nr:hypothetical protein [Datura stramonium]
MIRTRSAAVGDEEPAFIARGNGVENEVEADVEHKLLYPLRVMLRKCSLSQRLRLGMRLINLDIWVIDQAKNIEMTHHWAHGGEDKRTRRYDSFNGTSSQGQDFSGRGHHFQSNRPVHVVLQTLDSHYSGYSSQGGAVIVEPYIILIESVLGIIKQGGTREDS